MSLTEDQRLIALEELHRYGFAPYGCLACAEDPYYDDLCIILKEQRDQ